MVLTTPHLIYMGLASLWRIPVRELTVIKELVAQYKVQAQFPPGKYWIVDRGSGGFLSSLKAHVQDQWNKIRSGAEFGRDEWFALYKDDWGIDDGAWVDHVYRGLFRLHPGTVSEGCITIAHNSDYALIRNALMNTELIQVPCMRSLMARGCIEVVDGGYSYTCP